MAEKPIEMNKLRIVLKLHTQGKSKSFISTYLRLSRNTVKKYIKQFATLNTTYEDLAELDDARLEELFIKTQTEALSPKLKALYAFFPYAEKELKKRGYQDVAVGRIQGEISRWRAKHPVW